MTNGTTRYRGKYFTIKELNKKFIITGTDSGNFYGKHNTLAVAKARVKKYNQQAKKLPWWDRD